MSDTTITRNQKICVLCKYWNGSIGSTTIQILPGGTMFRIDNYERKSCFKPGKGIETNALFTCPNFKPRYEN